MTNRPTPKVPPVYRPARAATAPNTPKAVQMRPARPTVPPVYRPARPAAHVAGTVQRMDKNLGVGTDFSKGQSEVSKFVVKAEESKRDDLVSKRQFSPSSRYEFRTYSETMLPDSGVDPVEGKKKRDPDGYYYHITSYANLRNINLVGLNPAEGGGVGGSSFQNADKEMNQASAKDSQGKVFVATVSKLTQRYLSFRLRQEDLIEKHREFIVATIVDRSKYKGPVVHMMLDRLQLGEMPAVLRFKDVWKPDDWVHDPIEKKAYALVGKQVPPAQIECLTHEGWVPVSAMTEIASVFARKDFEVQLRAGLLKFFSENNALMEKQGAIFELEEALAEELKKSKFLQ